MNEKLWEKIEKASKDSINNPGHNTKPLPKKESRVDPEIYLFRHGETFDNKLKIYSGWRDSNLTERGKRQAEILASKLKDKAINLCITSTQTRSIETAKIALKFHPDVVFEEDPRIMERNYGELQGESKEKWIKEKPELAIKYRRGYDFPPPKGESLKMVEERVFPFCRELVERIRKNNINVAISAHGNSMRAIRKFFENMPLIEELTIENPLGRDYAQYVVKNRNFVRASYKYPKHYLKKLLIPNKEVIDNFED